MAAIKAFGNQTVSYNAVAFESSMNQSTLQVTVEELDATTYASTGEEVVPGVQDWSHEISGLWNPTIDASLGVDAITPPTTKRTFISVTNSSDALNDTTWTWTANAFVGNYTITAGRGLIEYSAAFGLNGNPTRS